LETTRALNPSGNRRLQTKEVIPRRGALMLAAGVAGE
jgi:hypothetical protein